jgi:Na+/pantothenate symporter
VPIYFGRFWKKANKAGVIASIVSGLTVMMYFLFKSGFYNINYYIHPVIPSFISALLFFFIFTIIGDKYENKT